MAKLPRICEHPTAGKLIEGLGGEFAVVENPDFIHPPYELYPLAPKAAPPLGELLAVALDMDGTTTTTETLCLHSLETMVRRMNGWETPDQWPGFADGTDHPHIIGNSTTRHVEYLIDKYGEGLEKRTYLAHLIAATWWTIASGRDEGRRAEAHETLNLLGLGTLAREEACRRLLETPGLSLDGIQALSPQLADQYLDRFQAEAKIDLVRGGIEIYYARYHQLLEEIALGRGHELAGEVMGRAGARLIEPMPGVALFMTAIKGWLSPEEAARLLDQEGSLGDWGAVEGERRERFLRAVGQFQKRPLKVAIVTSSIRHEAKIVLGELFEAVRGQIADWPLEPKRKNLIQEELSGPETYYDAMVTASDSSEIRLKPHRDLYSIALHRLGLRPDQFGMVLGLEDSESGIIAQRAAGIGLTVAVPFAQTRGHRFKAAARVCEGGLPEVMFEEGFFLDV